MKTVIVGMKMKNLGTGVQTCALPISCMHMRVGLQRKLSTEELMLLNCGVGEDS